MKNSIKINLVIIFNFLLITNIIAQDAIYVSYDEEYMDKYQYKIENLSAYDYHNAYHIYTSNTDRIVLNTAMSSYQAVSPTTIVQSPTSVNWTTTLLNEINNDVKEIYLVFNEGNSRYSYKVSTAVLVEESTNQIMYAGPYYSYTYDKKKAYDISEDLAGGKFTIYSKTIFMNSTQGDAINCFKQYNFMKVIKETHPKGSFTMIADSDFTRLKMDEVYETCQTAIYVDYLENIGIIEERTKNGKITLIGINDETLDSYIAKRCMPKEYNTTNRESVQPVDGQPGLNFFTKNDNVAKSGTETAIPAQQTTNITIINASADDGNTVVEEEYELIYNMVDQTQSEVVKENININTENTKKGVAGSVIHVVDNGETLYGISKKYGITIEELQKLNSLEGTAIEVTQILLIKQ